LALHRGFLVGKCGGIHLSQIFPQISANNTTALVGDKFRFEKLVKVEF
jgi:hypothetical protein